MSLAGFGFALLSIPFLCLILTPKMAIPLELILGCVLNLLLFTECYRQVKIKKITYLLVGGIIGIPFGAYFLARCSSSSLRIFISIITLLFALLLSLGISKRFERENIASLVAGLISGGLRGSSGMAGIPIVLFGLNQDWEKEEFRATLISYFTFLALITLPIFFKFGLFTVSIGKLALMAFPMLVLGFVGGRRLKNKVSQKVFRKIALALITVAGIFGLISNLGKVFD